MAPRSGIPLEAFGPASAIHGTPVWVIPADGASLAAGRKFPSMELLTESEALSNLAKADLTHIAVIDMGEPYVTPIAFAVDRRRVPFRSGPG